MLPACSFSSLASATTDSESFEVVIEGIYKSETEFTEIRPGAEMLEQSRLFIPVKIGFAVDNVRTNHSQAVIGISRQFAVDLEFKTKSAPEGEGREYAFFGISGSTGV